jgi:hypothetical protein
MAGRCDEHGLAEHKQQTQHCDHDHAETSVSLIGTG